MSGLLRGILIALAIEVAVVGVLYVIYLAVRAVIDGALW